jgi:hypothetical protein
VAFVKHSGKHIDSSKLFKKAGKMKKGSKKEGSEKGR